MKEAKLTHTQIMLRTLKEKHGCTWKSIAEALDVDPNTVRRWARGDLNVRQPRVLRLALLQIDATGFTA